MTRGRGIEDSTHRFISAGGQSPTSQHCVPACATEFSAARGTNGLCTPFHSRCFCSSLVFFTAGRTRSSTSVSASNLTKSECRRLITLRQEFVGNSNLVSVSQGKIVWRVNFNAAFVEPVLDVLVQVR